MLLDLLTLANEETVVSHDDADSCHTDSSHVVPTSLDMGQLTKALSRRGETAQSVFL